MADRSEPLAEEAERQAERRPASKKLAPLKALRPFLKPYRGMIAAVYNTVYSFIRDLVGYICAAITKYTPGHMQLDIWSDIFSYKCSACKFITRTCFTVIIAEVLQ